MTASTRAGSRLALLLSAGLVVAGLGHVAPAEAASRPTCLGKRATIVSGKKTVRGTNRADVIVGGRRTQTIYGRGGADRICGGRGNDTIFGGGGNDRFNGGRGTDRCFQGTGTGTRTNCEGPMLALTAAKAGAGAGTVTSLPSGLDCGTTCSASYPEGTLVTLSAGPAAGSSFTGWSGPCSGTGDCTVTITAATSVTATFSITSHTLTAAKDGSGAGTVASDPAGIDCGLDCTGDFAEGAEVTLTASPAAGSLFTGWSGGGCSGTGSCVATVTAAATITASFTIGRTLTVVKVGTGTGSVTSSPAGISCGGDCSELLPNGQSVTLTATPSVGSVFTSWSGCDSTNTNECTVALGTDREVTATFTASTFGMTVTRNGSGTGTVSSAPSGISCGGDCSEDFAANMSVTLSAAADAGSVFNGWSGGGCSGTASCVVTMDQARSVTATFTIGRTLTVDRDDGTGSGTVASSPAGITCGSDCTEDFADGATIVLTATPSASSTFAQWFGCDSMDGNTCTVTMGSARTVNAEFTLKTYLLTVERTGQGSVTSSIDGISCGVDCTETYTHGASLTLSAAASAGWAFSGWGGACSGTGTCNVTMDAAKTVTATFVERFTLGVTKAGTGSGSITSSPAGITCGGDCDHQYNEGTSVTLTATAGTGSTFTTWSGCDSTSGNQCTVSMDDDRSVEATFTLQSYLLTVNRVGQGTVTSSPAGVDCGADCAESHTHGTVVTLSASPAAGWAFTGWSGSGCSGVGSCVVTMEGAATVTATFLQRFGLTVTTNGTGGGTVSSDPSGITCPGDCAEDYNDGTIVTLTATPDATSSFTSWTNCPSPSGSQCTVTMTAARSVQATFTRITHVLTANRAGGGTGTVSSSPAGIDCGSDCTEAYTTGTEVTLTATPSGASAFTGWSGACTGTGTCIVTMDAARSVTATFVPAFTLTVNRNGTGSGTVQSNLSGIDCGSDCTENYLDGTTVILTATPGSSSNLVLWSGCDSVNGNDCTVTMGSGRTATATFDLKTYALSVTTGGAGSGAVSSSPSGITCGEDCSESYNHGTAVTLTATPSAGSRFGTWTNCDSPSGNQCTVSMTSAKSVSASFVVVRLLSVTLGGNGAGSVSSSPSGIDCGSDCSESFDDGTSVTLTAAPGANSTFTGWTGAGCSGTDPCAVTMDAAKSVTATFALQTRSLTVEKSGTGGGSVSSSPSGIDCGATCSAGFDHGAAVTLTATGDATSRFAGWSGGGCSGTGTCLVTMDAAKTVTASFVRITLSLTKSSMGTVTSSPAGISCGSTCTSQSANYAYNTDVTLTASGRTPLIGAYTWGGACAGTGNVATCVVNMDDAKSVTITIT